MIMTWGKEKPLGFRYRFYSPETRPYMNSSVTRHADGYRWAGEYQSDADLAWTLAMFGRTIVVRGIEAVTS